MARKALTVHRKHLDKSPTDVKLSIDLNDKMAAGNLQLTSFKLSSVVVKFKFLTNNVQPTSATSSSSDSCSSLLYNK